MPIGPNLETTEMSFVGEYLDKLWYFQTMEYDSALKKEEKSYYAMKRQGGSLSACY